MPENKKLQSALRKSTIPWYYGICTSLCLIIPHHNNGYILSVHELLLADLPNNQKKLRPLKQHNEYK